MKTDRPSEKELITIEQILRLLRVHEALPSRDNRERERELLDAAECLRREIAEKDAQITVTPNNRGYRWCGTIRVRAQTITFRRAAFIQELLQTADTVEMYADALGNSILDVSFFRMTVVTGERKENREWN